MDPKPARVPLETTSPDTPPAVANPPESGPAAPAQELAPEQQEALTEQVVAAIKTCYDPEIPVNIHELGLIYGIEVSATAAVHIRMTLTSPGCPAAGSLPPEVQAKVRAIPGVTAAKVDVVWDPPWTPELMSEGARLQLGIFD